MGGWGGGSLVVQFDGDWAEKRRVPELSTGVGKKAPWENFPRRPLPGVSSRGGT